MSKTEKKSRLMPQFLVIHKLLLKLKKGLLKLKLKYLFTALDIILPPGQKTTLTKT